MDGRKKKEVCQMKKNKIVWIALLMCLLVVLSGCAAKNENDPEKSTEETQNTEAQETKFYTTDEDCYSIETKYGKLEYPEKWKNITKTEIVEEEPYTVQFFCVTSAGDVPLFDLHFGGGEGFLLGTLPQDGKNIPMYLESFDIDQSAMSEEEYFNCCAMSEDVNVIISRLIEKNGLVLSDNEQVPELPEDNGEVFAIETKYGTLSYPEKWKELSKIEIVESPIYTVKFSGKTASGDIPLFDLNFDGGDGYRLGSMKVDGQDVTIYLDDYSFDQGTLSDEDYFNCCAMQEDVNVILEHLAQDYSFTFG